MLYTGRLDLSKGLLEMIEALAIIRANGVTACLHLVGWEDKNAKKVIAILHSKADLLGISKFVFFHGKKQVGEELNSFYRMADIFIIGSKVNEGFPRTIWEAFANSIPVVASAVGSIPIFLRNNVDVVLIEPGSVSDMTNALERVIRDGGLRKSIIKNAHEVAKSNTLESQSAIMIKAMRENVDIKTIVK